MDIEIAKLILTGIISPTIALFCKYWYDKKTKENELKLEQEKIPEVSLKNHPFFERMKVLRAQISTLSIQNKGKQAVIRDILANKFTIVIEEYWNMIVEIDEKHEDLTDEELFNIINNSVREGLKKHLVYYVDGDYTIQEKQCLEIVMQKFNVWHSHRVNNLFQSIQNVCFSKFYPDIVSKTSVCLDVLLAAFIDVISDAELTLNQLNGDLKGLTFKNITI